MPFERWNDRLNTAIDADSRRALAIEIGLWRARNLTNIPGQRDAAFALATLHQKNGDPVAAKREAEGLMSLCQSPPEAVDEEIRAARGLLQNLGGRPIIAAPPPRRERPERNERSERPERPARQERAERPPRNGPIDLSPAGREPAAADVAVQAAAFGRWDEALAALDGRKGDRADLLRAYVILARALAEGDEVRRAKELGDLERHLRARVLQARPAERAAAPARPETPRGAPVERPARAPRAERPALTDDPLSKLLGAPVPGDRQARIDAIEAAAAKIDADDLA
jgi:hypothetical protein